MMRRSLLDSLFFSSINDFLIRAQKTVSHSLMLNLCGHMKANVMVGRLLDDQVRIIKKTTLQNEEVA